MDALDDEKTFDYTHVEATARVAVYDDFKSAPRVVEVSPAETNEFIEKLTTTIYEQSKMMGGKVPYTLIREVSENFIHARFNEIVVSIYDDGNTIRFADQGPGIKEKEKAQQPGFTSAIEPMKRYIRGVGSGFPIVRDYLDDREGSIVIEDNLVSGAVVTISLMPKKEEVKQPERKAAPVISPPPLPLTDRELLFLQTMLREGELGVTELKELTGTPASSTYNTLKKLEDAGLIEKSTGKKRWLTEIGFQIASSK